MSYKPNDGYAGLNALARHWQPLLQRAEQRRQPLLTWLGQTAQQRGLTTPELAAQLGLTGEQVLQLFMGVVDPARVSRDAYRSMARWLALPRIAVRCAAHDIRLEDFYTRSELAQHFWTVPQRLKVPTLIETTDLTVAFAGVLAGWSNPCRERMRSLVADTPG